MANEIRRHGLSGQRSIKVHGVDWVVYGLVALGVGGGFRIIRVLALTATGLRP